MDLLGNYDDLSSDSESELNISDKENNQNIRYKFENPLGFVNEPFMRRHEPFSTLKCADILSNTDISLAVDKLPPFPQPGDVYLLYSEKEPNENWKLDSYAWKRGSTHQNLPPSHPLITKHRKYSPNPQSGKVHDALLFRKVAVTLYLSQKLVLVQYLGEIWTATRLKRP